MACDQLSRGLTTSRARNPRVTLFSWTRVCASRFSRAITCATPPSSHLDRVLHLPSSIFHFPASTSIHFPPWVYYLHVRPARSLLSFSVIWLNMRKPEAARKIRACRFLRTATAQQQQQQPRGAALPVHLRSSPFATLSVPYLLLQHRTVLYSTVLYILYCAVVLYIPNCTVPYARKSLTDDLFIAIRSARSARSAHHRGLAPLRAYGAGLFASWPSMLHLLVDRYGLCCTEPLLVSWSRSRSAATGCRPVRSRESCR